MNEPLAAITGILVLATIAEALVEHLFAPILDAKTPEDDKADPILGWKALALRYTAVLIGVALCIVYQADILLYFDLTSPWPWVGYLITGILIGRGSNFVHDFATRWLTRPPYE